MKNIILLIAILFAIPSFSNAQSLDLSVQSKEIIIDAIAEYVFFEDEGYVRAPQGIEDFQFQIVDENKIIVTGESLSDWDMQDIKYYCEIKVLSRGVIEKAQDIEIDFCQLENEHWPHM